MRSSILPTERWGYPKNHQNVFQKPLLASQMSSPCPAPGCTGIRQEPALSLYRQNQTDRPLHMSSSMIIDSGKLKPPIFPGHQLLLVFSLLSINSSHSDPPPKGWHFSSCASWGKYPSLFWNSILRNCRQRVSRIVIFLPGKREAYASSDLHWCGLTSFNLPTFSEMKCKPSSSWQRGIDVIPVVPLIIFNACV